jgi:hypothetical protein
MANLARAADTEACAHVKADLAVGADVLPQQRGQAAPVGRAGHPGPFLLGGDVLEHGTDASMSHDARQYPHADREPFVIEPGREDDLPAIAEILNYTIANSNATLATEPVTVDERREWFGCSRWPARTGSSLPGAEARSSAMPLATASTPARGRARFAACPAERRCVLRVLYDLAPA